MPTYQVLYPPYSELYIDVSFSWSLLLGYLILASAAGLWAVWDARRQPPGPKLYNWSYSLTRISSAILVFCDLPCLPKLRSHAVPEKRKSSLLSSGTWRSVSGRDPFARVLASRLHGL